jgi:hypothetical protein
MPIRFAEHLPSLYSGHELLRETVPLPLSPASSPKSSHSKMRQVDDTQFGRPFHAGVRSETVAALDGQSASTAERHANCLQCRVCTTHKGHSVRLKDCFTKLIQYALFECAAGLREPTLSSLARWIASSLQFQSRKSRISGALQFQLIFRYCPSMSRGCWLFCQQQFLSRFTVHLILSCPHDQITHDMYLYRCMMLCSNMILIN